jgi:hypothetical protein
MEIIIFGVGQAGRALFRKFIQLKNYNIIGFIDNNPNIVGSKYKNINIYSSDELSLLKYDKIVYSGIHHKSMLKQLKQLKIKDDKILFIDDNQLTFNTPIKDIYTDKILKVFSDICIKENITYFIDGSSLIALFRKKSLSSVGDIDIVLKDYRELIELYNILLKYSQKYNYDLKKSFYKQELSYARCGEIKGFILTSNDSTILEPLIMDISIMSIFKNNNILEYGESDKLFYFPANYHNKTRLIKYKDMKLSIPEKAEEFLTLIYGKDWIIPPKSWSEDDYSCLVDKYNFIIKDSL